MGDNVMNCENYDPCFPDQPVVDLYLPVWARHPSIRSKPAFVWVDDGAIIDGDRGRNRVSSLTFYQLNYSVQSISSNLVIHLQRGETVLILCSPGLQLVQILFGCQRAGLLSVPIMPPDPSFATDSRHHLVRVLLQTKPKAAIADKDYITSVQRYISSSPKDKQLCDLLQKLKWLSVDDIDDHVADSKSDSSVYHGCKPRDVYLIQYTSGATGIPKPVLVTAGSAAHNVRAARKAYDLHPNSIIVSWLPQYHDCGLMFLLLTIVSGATCVLTSPSAFVLRPRLWLELITEFKATCTPVPSFALPLVVRRGGIDKGTLPIKLWSLRNLIIVNEPIYRSHIDEFVNEFTHVGLRPSSISPSYGLAENGTFVSTAWRSIDGESGSFPNVPSYNKLLPSARLAGMNPEYSELEEEEEEIEIIVVNEETCEPVDDGIEGEIWVSSPSNASGYLGHPSLTQEVFHGRLRNKVSRRYVRTGDRGVVRGEKRYLFVVGRCADVIKVQNGRELHPHYLETTAYDSNPKILRGGCLAAFQISRKLVVVAELLRSEVEHNELRKACEGIKDAVVKEWNVEIGLVVLVKSGNVPKTTSGKIQRWAAEHKFVRGELNIVTEIQFSTHKSLPSLRDNEAPEEMGSSRVVDGDSEEPQLVVISSARNRLSLISSL